MKIRLASLFAVVFALMLSQLAPELSAAPERGKEAVGRRLGNDVFAAGADIRLTDEIYGDAIAAGGSVTLGGTVRGDTVAAGGELKLRGSTDEDLYAAGGEVLVTGHVAGSARIAGGEVELDRDAVIDGGVSLAGGRVVVDGRVGQYLQIAAGSARLDGRIGGDVEASGGELTVGPGAVIDGTLTFRGPEPPEVAASAQVRGGVQHIPAKGDRHALRAALGLAALVWLAGWIIAGCVLLAIWPGFASSVTNTATQRFGLSLLGGFLLFVGMPVAIVLLAISLVGIPLGLFVLCAYLVLLPLGYLASATAIGDWLLPRIRRGAGIATRHRIFMLLGVLVALSLLTRVPVLGGILTLLVILTGMGSIVIAATGRYRGTGAAMSSVG